MNKVILSFEYDDTKKAMIEPALKSFMDHCISHGQSIELKKFSPDASFQTLRTYKEEGT